MSLTIPFWLPYGQTNFVPLNKTSLFVYIYSKYNTVKTEKPCMFIKWYVSLFLPFVRNKLISFRGWDIQTFYCDTIKLKTFSFS